MTKAAAIRHDALPPPTRRGLHREEAAAYVGVSPSTFDKVITDGLMPTAVAVYGRKVWDVRALDRAFDALPGGPVSAQDDNDGGWDEVLK